MVGDLTSASLVRRHSADIGRVHSLEDSCTNTKKQETVRIDNDQHRCTFSYVQRRSSSPKNVG